MFDSGDKPLWTDGVFAAGENLLGPPLEGGTRYHHGAVSLGEYMVIYGGACRESGQISSELIGMKEFPGRVDFRTGEEAQEWRKFGVQNPLARAGHSMCFLDGQVFMFGGVDQSGRLHNQIYSLSYTRIGFGNATMNRVAPLRRDRGAGVRKCMLTTRQHGDDAATGDTCSQSECEDTVPSPHMPSSSVQFTFPGVREHHVIPQLPDLVATVGPENCFDIQGSSLNELGARSQNRGP